MFRPRILAAVFSALTLFSAVAPAYAGERDGIAQRERPNQKEAERAIKFQAKVSDRIQKALDEAIAKVNADPTLTVGRKAAIIGHAKAEAKEVKAAAARAARDGKVTKEEAKRVRELARVDAKKIKDMIPGPRKLPQAQGPGHAPPRRVLTPVR